MGDLYLRFIQVLDDFFLLSSDSRSIYLGILCYFFSVLVLRRPPLSWKSQRLGFIAAFGIFFFDVSRFQMQKMQIPPELVQREMMKMAWNCMHGFLLPLSFVYFLKQILKNKQLKIAPEEMDNSHQV